MLPACPSPPHPRSRRAGVPAVASGWPRFRPRQARPRPRQLARRAPAPTSQAPRSPRRSPRRPSPRRPHHRLRLPRRRSSFLIPARSLDRLAPAVRTPGSCRIPPPLPSVPVSTAAGPNRESTRSRPATPRDSSGSRTRDYAGVDASSRARLRFAASSVPEGYRLRARHAQCHCQHYVPTSRRT